MAKFPLSSRDARRSRGGAVLQAARLGNIKPQHPQPAQTAPDLLRFYVNTAPSRNHTRVAHVKMMNRIRSTTTASHASPLSWQRTMDDMIHRFANLKQTPVSVKNMIVFGKDANMNTLLRSHAFLRCELPIRLAHIAKEITALPPELLEVEPVQKVLNWYRLSFSGASPHLLP
jgi:hypothetical protein